MSKVTVIVCLMLAALVAFVGGAVEPILSVPSSVWFGTVLLTVLLLMYPAVKSWYSERRVITFTQWALTALVASIATVGLVYIFRRI